MTDADLSLRTTFTAQEGEPVQVVAESLTLELPVVDLRDRPAPDREAELQVLSAMEAQRSFDLSRGPLLRVMLVQQDDAGPARSCAH